MSEENVEIVRRSLEALGLWRGDPLADFSYEPFAQAEIARLEELRVSALEERIDADIALGRHAAVVGELEALVREHPLRERLRGQLMLALYRAGRQAEALEVYQDAHHALTEELGIVPGPDLQRLEQAILRHDAELELPAGVSAEPARAAESAAPPPESRRTVTVLVATRPRAESIDPEVAHRLDERYLDAATRAVERHGGSVESVLGDRVMAVFGVPRVHEDDALRAARAAVELPGGQAGVATGEVVASESASGGRSLTGEPVARAGELADSAPTGGPDRGTPCRLTPRCIAQHRTPLILLRADASVLTGTADALARDDEQPSRVTPQSLPQLAQGDSQSEGRGPPGPLPSRRC